MAQRFAVGAVLATVAACGSRGAPPPAVTATPELQTHGWVGPVEGKARLAQPRSEVYEPEASVQTAAELRFLAQHGPAWEVDVDPVLRTARSLRGEGLPFPLLDTTEAALERAAFAFVREHADLFGTTELVFDGAVVDPSLVTIMLAQRHHGLPVIGGHLGLAISHGRLVLAHGATYPVTDLPTQPRIALATAIRAASTAIDPEPATGDRDEGRLVVFPERTAGAVAYHLAWEVTAWRGASQAIAYVDARDGHVLAAYDANHYGYSGTATHPVDARTVGDEIVNLPAAFLRLSSQAGIATADANGAFAFRGDAVYGRDGVLRGELLPLLVTADLRGAYVDVRNVSGANAKFVGMMRADKPYTLEWTETRSTPEERQVFRAVNATNRFVGTVFTDLPWMSQPLVANVNHKQNCNAYWNGSSINFFVAGRGCNNSGRIFDVVAHEWGHGLDQFAPGGAADGALGEFIGDLLSFIQTDSPLLAPGFFTDGRAVRDLEDPKFECFDPKKREVHDAGQLLGAVMWDVYVDLKAAGLTGEPLKRLLVRPIAIAQTRAQWYGALLAVDDDDGNLANGTPHECLIYDQFEAHSCKGTRWPGMPAQRPAHCPKR